MVSRSSPPTLSSLRLSLLAALVALQAGCWSKPPDSTFACEVDDDCPGGLRCLPSPEDGGLACYKGSTSTSPSTSPDAGETRDACAGTDCGDGTPAPDAGPEADGGSDTTPTDGGGPPTPSPDAGDGSAPVDAGQDAAADAGTDASKPECKPSEALTRDAPCGNCNLGRKKQQRTWLTATCTYSEWKDMGDCEEKADCKPGAVMRLLEETCGPCGKGKLTPTKTCTSKCEWGPAVKPECTLPKNVCTPQGLGGQGWRCCAMGKWEWCYEPGFANSCTWTGGCETCQGCSC